MDRNEKKELYKVVFGNKEGQEVLEDLCKFCHLTHPTFGNSIDVNSMIFAEGEKNVAMYILNMLHVRPVDQLVDMAMKEN